jgi:hypothetical protein
MCINMITQLLIMLSRFYKLIFKVSYLNPHGFEPYDLSSKLKGEINGNRIVILRAKDYSSNQWIVQLMSSGTDRYDRYKYVDHVFVSREPGIFLLLFKGNSLVSKWLEDLSK